MKKLLVTGGCGFIGSNFVRLQLDTYPDVEIVNVDVLTYAGNPENLADLDSDSRYHFERGDIADSEFIGGVFERHPDIDAVVNFAAESHVDRSILDSGPFVRTNINGTQVLLDASRQADVERYLQVSTDEVYGSLGDDGFFTEETPLAPNSPYSASKAAADMLVRSYYHTHHMPVVITRCSNNYGPYQFPEKLIPLFISNALNDQPLPVYGEGTNVRDWIHVMDHARGVDTALRNGEVGEVYNFGGHGELQNIELTKKLLDALEKPHSLIKYVEDRKGHDFRYAIDTSKVERELNWKLLVDFEEGLRDTINWYLSNTVWVERVRSGAYRDYYEKQYGNRLNAQT